MINLSLILGLLLAVGQAVAQESQPSEYRLKAAFLYHFAQFVDWPPAAFTGPGSPLIIGVLGQNPFGAALEETIRGKTLANRPLQVREFHSVEEVTNHCHILFISASEKKRLPEIFTGLAGASVLTVGETDRFTEAGGMINFVAQEKKIRFQINDDAAKIAGLKIGSKLLKLALNSSL